MTPKEYWDGLCDSDKTLFSKEVGINKVTLDHSINKRSDLSFNIVRKFVGCSHYAVTYEEWANWIKPTY